MAGRFVAEIWTFIDKLDGTVDILYIGSRPKHIDRTFIGGSEVLLFNTIRVHHYADFHVRLDAVYDSSYTIVIAILPCPVIFGREEFPAASVAEFHIVDAAFGKGMVNRTNKVIREVVVVNKSAVSDCAIENFDLFSVHIPTFYKRSLKFIQYFFHHLGSNLDGVLFIFAVNLANLAN